MRYLEYEKSDKDKEKRFEGFVTELEGLSKKYGIEIRAVGGVYIYNENIKEIKYQTDHTSGDLETYKVIVE